MAEKIISANDVHQQIKPGTAAMAAYLEAGYGMTLQEAETIVKERPDNPTLWPYEQYAKAQAMLAAYKAKPQVISTKQPWQINGRRPRPAR